MRPLTSIDAIAFAELLSRCRDAGEHPAYPPNGAFVDLERDGRHYWYYKGYERATDGAPARQTLKYVGLVGDPDVDEAARKHDREREAFKSRRDLAARLRRAGLPTPQPVEGAVAEVLQREGYLANGSCLVGSVAFQTYAGLLGVRLPEAGFRTEDLDVAQPPGVIVPPDGQPLRLLEALRAVDTTFEPIHDQRHPTLIAGFRNRSAFKVEFLTTVRSQSDAAAFLVPLSASSSVGAQSLKYLEYLMKEPDTSVVLYGAGVVVPVPQPMRFACHKLIVSVLRSAPGQAVGSPEKALKDVQQAETLIAASIHARQSTALGAAWLEAWNRGPNWKRVLRSGSLKLKPDALSTLAEGCIEASALDGSACPFDDAGRARQSLLSGRSDCGPGAGGGVEQTMKPKSLQPRPRSRKRTDGGLEG